MSGKCLSTIMTLSSNSRRKRRKLLNMGEGAIWFLTYTKKYRASRPVPKPMPEKITNSKIVKLEHEELEIPIIHLVNVVN